jgi:O-antigen ligase
MIRPALRSLSPVLRWVLFALGLVLVAMIGGQQIASPNERVLQVVAAGLLVFVAFRSSSISALAFAVLLLPFPKATSYGNTNVALILLILIVWVYRLSRKTVTLPGFTSVDLPIVGLVMTYALSFYNVQGLRELQLSWSIFLAFLTYLVLTYLVISIVRTPEDVKKILVVQLVSGTLVCLGGVYELFNPSSALIPGWIEFGRGYELSQSGVRIGSTFIDFELFAEFCSLMLLLQIFLFSRANTKSRRVMIVGIMGITLLCLFATVTRGAIISLGVGLVYLMWLSRRRLNFVRLTTVVLLGAGILGTADFVVSNYTKSASVMDRLLGTQLQGGFVPETRAGAWEQSIDRIMDHPIIGHGPYFALERSLEVTFWPHNLYLFYWHITGILGLGCFLWLLYSLWKATKPRAASLGSGTFVEGATLLMRVMLVTFMVDQIKIEYLRNERYAFFVWFLFGLMVAVDRIAKREAAMSATLHAVPPEEAAPRPLRRTVGAVSARPAVSPR